MAYRQIGSGLPDMNRQDFEHLLDVAAAQLSNEVRLDAKYHDPLIFQDRVKVVLSEVAAAENLTVNGIYILRSHNRLASGIIES
jgi:hypothetical protein